jgi:hypothetical protein
MADNIPGNACMMWLEQGDSTGSLIVHGTLIVIVPNASTSRPYASCKDLFEIYMDIYIYIYMPSAKIYALRNVM